MITLTVNPSPQDLKVFIDRIPNYPITAEQLVKMAGATKTPREVIDFYRSFSPGRLFEDREDLMASSEMIEMVRQEEIQMPREEEVAPEDY